MPRRSRNSNPDAKAAAEAQQKKLLFGMIGLVGLLLVVTAAWMLLGRADSGTSGTAKATPEGSPAEVKEEVVKGLGDNWEERLAEAQAAVDRLREKLTAEPSLKDDSVFGRLMGKSMAALASAKRESNGGDPVEARRSVAEVLESEHALLAYLKAKGALSEVVTRFDAARDVAVEFSLQSFQSDLYKEALALRQEAESATSEGDVELASRSYEAAIERLGEAKARFDATVAKARKVATAALESGDREGGEAAVQRILDRLPGDEFGERMRARLAVLDQTHPLYLKAMASEENDLLAVAEGQYRSILEKDPHHARASDGLARVVAARKVSVVSQRVSEAEAAAAAGELGEALELAKQALVLMPEDTRALQLKEDLQARFDSQRIDQSLKDAAVHEAAGEWEQAMELYAGLAADFPGLKEAKSGVSRVSKKVQQVKEARKLVEVAKESINVSSVAELEYAIGLLEKATRLDPNDPSIRILLEATQEDLKLMNAPVRVTLVSDGKTKIEVWKVGVFEAVTEHKLDLKPGTYTVVGKKPYYVNVKLDLTVPAGAEPMRFEVMCEEAL